MAAELAPELDDPRALDETSAFREKRARLRLVADRVAPMALARERTLPVLDVLSPLLPDAALRRGSVVGVSGPGATTLALALAAAASAAGSWVAAVGDPDLGLVAVEEAGIALERFLVVSAQPGTWSSTIAALVGAVDVVVTLPPPRVRAGDARRIGARLRERGSVLVCTGDRWPEGPDVSLSVVKSEWQGVGDGHGLLSSRRVVVNGGGRGAAARPRSAELLLPGPLGAAAACLL